MRDSNPWAIGLSSYVLHVWAPGMMSSPAFKVKKKWTSNLLTTDPCRTREKRERHRIRRCFICNTVSEFQLLKNPISS